jgi:hypothetical protein
VGDARLAEAGTLGAKILTLFQPSDLWVEIRGRVKPLARRRCQCLEPTG